MRIGDLARRSGVPAKTIRYYESIGLLSQPARTSSGYRDYDESVLGRLRFIKAGQAVGFRLGELREVIAFRERGEVPCDHVRDLLERRVEQVDETIASLERTRAELRRLARRAARLRPEDCTADDVCHLVLADPSRTAAKRSAHRP